ncbi:MAG: amidohydrolase family protein [Ignavibacteriales bacterium]|nr:amidohydrolase family protein [Ignavibacteriales bacterium]
MKLITNGKIVLENKILAGEIRIVDDTIAEIGKKLRRDKKYEIIDAKNKYVIPGFIDIHTNGSAGFDLTCGRYDQDKHRFVLNKKDYRKGIENALKFYLSKGTTKVLLSSISAPLQQTLNNFAKVADYKSDDSYLSRVLYGLYVEGSFIKDSQSRGAQNPKYFLKPTRTLIDQIRKSSRDFVKIINLPPEWGGETNKIIKTISDEEIICTVGHSTATANQTYSAVLNGTILSTHFLNGPSSASFKPFNGGGMTEAILKSPEVYAEIIPDGYHVNKSYVLDVIKRKGLDRVIAVTDNMFIAGMKSINEFNFMGIRGKLSDNKKYLFVKERPSALFGSVLTMDEAFSNLLNWFSSDEPGVWNPLHRAMKFEEAIIVAVNMCSHNPANLLSMRNPNIRFGKIKKGYNADILIVDLHRKGKKTKMKIKETIFEGKKI